MRVLRLDKPSVAKTEIRFRWSVTGGDYPLRKPEARLGFPSELDLGLLDERFLLILSLMIHWPLLNLAEPVEVRLPARLSPSELESLQRLCDLQRAALVGLTSERSLRRGIRFVSGSVAPRTRPRREVGSGLATGLSGGKESLTQLLLARSAGLPVAAVPTTSPLPPSTEHESPHRRWVLDELPGRFGVPVYEVESDLRGSYDNEYPRRLGYGVWLTDLLDCQLYLASTAVVAYCLGFDAFGVGGEWEIASCRRRRQIPVFHPHVMYNPATLSGLSALVEPHRLRVVNLLTPLTGYANSLTLNRLYPESLDLLVSCYTAKDGSRWCNRCEKCVRTAVFLFSDGTDPRRVGLCWREVWSRGFMRHREHFKDWWRRRRPAVTIEKEYHYAVLLTLRKIPFLHGLGAILRPRGARARPWSLVRAVVRYATAYLIAVTRAKDVDESGILGVKIDAVTLVDERLRDAVTAAVERAGLPLDGSGRLAEVEANHEASDYVRAPLDGTRVSPSWKAFVAEPLGKDAASAERIFRTR